METVSFYFLLRFIAFSQFFFNFQVVYVEMQDLLRDFDNPAVMDIKMGIR